jgi:hypothetical protein
VRVQLIKENYATRDVIDGGQELARGLAKPGTRMDLIKFLLIECGGGLDG